MFKLERRQFLAWGSLSALMVARRAAAHGFHAAFTVIEQNPRTDNLEIIHRLFTQDLDLALTARTGREGLLFDLTEAENQVEEYLRPRFALKSADGRTLTLEWVGMILQIDTVIIYQEVRAPGLLAGLVIDNQILAETHPRQVNTVNVTVGGHTKTLIFAADGAPQSVTF